MNAPSLSHGLRPQSSQGGFTLVELMIAMTLGLFLSAGVIALFIGTKQSYRANEGMARVQENGRFALDYLAQDARQLGFREIVYDTATPPAVPDPPKLADEIADPIMGWEGDTADPSTEALTTYTSNTDVIRIRYRFDSGTYVTRQILYYIGPDSAGGPPGLRQRIDDNPPTTPTPDSQELIEGVYDMQVRYGLNTNTYVNADAVTDWGQVTSLRIDLLLGSQEDNLVDTPMSLPFQLNDDTFFVATDRRIYQMFSTTVALRNQLP